MNPQNNGNMMNGGQGMMGGQQGFAPQGNMNTNMNAGMQAAGNMAMPGQMMGGPQGGYRSGLQKLAACSAIFIKQKVDIFEAITGGMFEQSNVYKVFACDPATGEPGSVLFKGKESSECIQRMFLAPDCRAFDMYVNHDEKDQMVPGGATQHGHPFLHFARPYAFTFACFNRPEMYVNLSEKVNPAVGDQEFMLGGIGNPWRLCDYELQVKDKTGEIEYTIRGTCCQGGILCPLPCDPCNKVLFEILDKNGEVVGSLKKVWAGCCKQMFTEADNFMMVFPPKATPEQKAVFMAAVMFMDYRYFEEKNQNNNGDSLVENLL